MWLGSRGREWSRGGLLWVDVEARAGASDQEGGCWGSALVGTVPVALGGGGGGEGNSHTCSLGGGQRGLTSEGSE